MRCVICGRHIRAASSYLPAQGGALPHNGGPVGPVCAVEAGLIRPPEKRTAATLLSRQPAARKRRIAVKPSQDDSQLDLLAEVTPC